MLIYVKIFTKFLAGGFSLNNALRSGTPVNDDRDQMKISLENNQHYTMQAIADLLKIPK